jgi:hypothetical protein
VLYRTSVRLVRSNDRHVRIYVFLAKVVLLKAVYACPLKIHQYTEFHGPTLAGASFATTAVL